MRIATITADKEPDRVSEKPLKSFQYDDFVPAKQSALM